MTPKQSIFAPIADKCVGLGNGNHEDNALKYTGRDVYKYIVRQISRKAGLTDYALALGVQGFVLLRFRRKSANAESGGSGWTLPVFVHHGAGGGRLAGGDALMLERALGDFAADLILVGHRHKARILSRAFAVPTTRGVRVVSRIAMMSASYMRPYVEPEKGFPVTTYAENFMLPPTTVGATPILIDPDSRSFTVMMTSGGEGAGENVPAFVANAAAAS